MSVAGRQKTILVTGDRVWRDGRPSDPQPFESMPLVWERAFGGCIGAAKRFWPRSATRLDADSPEDVPRVRCRVSAVPNLEDPAAPLQQLGQAPVPACLAPIAPSWLPRRAYAGTYDEQWQRARAPYLPDDFDPRFFQCAAPEFAFDRYLQPGEPVQVAGVMPDGPIAFHSAEWPHLKVAVTVAGSTAGAAREPRDAVDRARRQSRLLYLARGGAVRSPGAEGRKDRRQQVERRSPVMSAAVIGATHVLCSIGSGTDQAWASARAGIARIGSSHVMDRHFEPIQMGLVPEDALGELVAGDREPPAPVARPAHPEACRAVIPGGRQGSRSAPCR